MQHRSYINIFHVLGVPTRGYSQEVLDIRTGEKVDYSELKKLFTPTGPIQELSIENGWGQSFIELANRFDSAALFRS